MSPPPTCFLFQFFVPFCLSLRAVIKSDIVITEVDSPGGLWNNVYDLTHLPNAKFSLLLFLHKNSFLR